MHGIYRQEPLEIKRKIEEYKKLNGVETPKRVRRTKKELKKLK